MKFEMSLPGTGTGQCRAIRQDRAAGNHPNRPADHALMLNVEPDISELRALAICCDWPDGAGLASAGAGFGFTAVCWACHAAAAAPEPDPPTRIPISNLPDVDDAPEHKDGRAA